MPALDLAAQDFVPTMSFPVDPVAEPKPVEAAAKDTAEEAKDSKPQIELPAQKTEEKEKKPKRQKKVKIVEPQPD